MGHCSPPLPSFAEINDFHVERWDDTAEARCLPLSESEDKRGGFVIPKYALCNRSKDES